MQASYCSYWEAWETLLAEGAILVVTATMGHAATAAYWAAALAALLVAAMLVAQRGAEIRQSLRSHRGYLARGSIDGPMSIA